MSGNESPNAAYWGKVVGALDVRGGRTKRIEIRIKEPDETHRFPTLLVMRHMTDGRSFSIPIFATRAREFAQILDAAIRILEDRGDA